MIVGLAGYAGAGKDTAAEALVAAGYRQDAFAATLKAMALDLNPWIVGRESYSVSRLLRDIVKRHGWDEAKRRFHEVREWLQDIGGAVREHLGEDTWAKALCVRMDLHPDDPFVITDVRYPNEAQWLADYHPHRLIWIDRPGLGPVNDHASDQGLVRHLCTHEIVNDGSVEELHAKILEVVGC